ncbi:MAG TPA: hypothetical protein VJS45_09505 [Acidimicrobiia bacterium]|nr:hypothetical protein [Acidimicrobiia bacterium]
MTVMLIPEQLAEATDLGSEGELAEPEDNEAVVRKLAALLAHAYVDMPLFP